MFLGMQNDLIALAANTREELENLECMRFTEITETEDNYILENGSYVKQDSEYSEKKLAETKLAKHAENIVKAKAAIENGYVVYKEAQFETNSQTVGDLTAAMLLMQATEQDTYFWLSKDDKEVTLNVSDFAALGALIAGFKSTVWNEKYLGYKSMIEQAETVEELGLIEIDY